MAGDKEDFNVPDEISVPSMDFAKHVAEMTRNTAWLALASLGVVFALGLVEALIGLRAWGATCTLLFCAHRLFPQASKQAQREPIGKSYSLAL